MRNQIKFVIKLCLALVVAVTSINVGANKSALKANELGKLVEITIDENSEDDGNIGAIINSGAEFDDIGRFNEFGLSIIRKTGTPINDKGELIYKYGIINTRGEIKQQLEYHEITEFDDKFYLTTKLNDFTYDYSYGLVFKETGETALEAKYNRIPNIRGNKFIQLEEDFKSSCDIKFDDFDSECFKAKTSFKSYKDGEFKEIFLPNSIDLSVYDYVNIIDYSSNTKIMSARTYIYGNNYQVYTKTDNWIIDEYGNAISESIPGEITSHLNYKGIDYFSFNKNTSFDFKDSIVALVKITSADGSNDNIKYNFDPIIDYKECFSYVIIDNYDNTVYYQNIRDNEYKTSGHIDLKISEIVRIKEDLSHKNNNKIGTYIIYSDDSVNLLGIKDNQGKIITEPIYQSYAYDEQLQLVGLVKSIELKDKENKVDNQTTTVIDIFSTKEGEIIQKNMFSNFEEDISKHLRRYGVTIFSMTTGEFTNYKKWGDNNDEYSFSPIIKSGLISRDGTVLIEPIYDGIISFNRQYPNLKTSGLIFEFEKIESEYSCMVPGEQGGGLEEKTCYRRIVSLYDAKTNNYILPFSEKVTEISEFDTSGLAVINKTELIEDDLNLNERSERIKTGLIHIEKGIILEPVYSSFSSHGVTLKNHQSFPNEESNNLPSFDENGYMHIHSLENYDFPLVGIADNKGVILHPIYRKAYYSEGNFYSTKDLKKWEIMDVDNIENKTVISLNNEVESLKIVNNKFVAKRKISDDISTLYEYKIFDKNGSEFIDYNFSKVDYADGYWYLERYDKDKFSYEKAIMDNNKNFIIPFDDKYDNISDFINGYAVGQKTNEESQILAISRFPKNLFLKVKANNGTVLELVNENGDVIEDLANKFKSVKLLGYDDGELKAIVENDDGIHMATLKDTEEGMNLKRAIKSVQQAENLKTNESIKQATKLIDNLIENDYKVSLTKRLNKLKGSNDLSPTPVPDSPENYVKNLKNILDGNNHVSDDEFIDIITKTNNDNKEFIDQLTNEQVEIYEARIRNVFKDNLIINQTNSKLNYTIKGIGLVPKIEDLVDNKKVEFKLEITDKFNENDKNVFNKYLEDLDITLKRQYPLEINLTQSVNTITSKITDMQRELSFTFPIPKDFMGIKDLDVIRIHDSKIDIIPAILNKDNTFTFKTDKLSTFILIEELHLEDNKFTSLERLGGINRIDTAALVSKKAYDRADNIVLTGISGEVDALTGTMLASYLDAPILFTDKNSLSKITETELTRLSAKNIYILGGRAVVSDSVVSKLSELGLKVERISGANRYETAAKIAEKPILTNTNHVFLASGLEDKNGTLADALTVGPASAKITSPVLLTQTNQLTTETKRALINLKVKEVTIIGGRSAINAEIEKQLDALGIIYNRLGGSDRFDTAIKIADNYFKDSKTALIANGLKMPDALVGGYFGKIKDAPILLTYPESLELKTEKHFNNNYDFSYILGGSKVVSHKTYNGLGKILID